MKTIITKFDEAQIRYIGQTLDNYRDMHLRNRDTAAGTLAKSRLESVLSNANPVHVQRWKQVNKGFLQGLGL